MGAVEPVAVGWGEEGDSRRRWVGEAVEVGFAAADGDDDDSRGGAFYSMRCPW